MPLTNAEFVAILGDNSKVIAHDIVWSEDEDHSNSVEFTAEVQTAVGWPLFVRGSYNRTPGVKALSYMLILKTVGRIYGLDLGKDHHNPSCTHTGEKHKHQWTEQFRDKDAYVPRDITCGADDPVGVWHQFLEEARIRHEGRMPAPPAAEQEEMW